MHPHPGPKLQLAPQRRLAMTLGLKQALEILQLPQLELAQWLLEQVELNPLLDVEAQETSCDSSLVLSPPQLPASLSFQERLHLQIRENFSSAFERCIAQELLEHIDERGFLSVSLDLIANRFQCSLAFVESILTVLQTFDPPGFCARDLRETLLIQLNLRHEQESLAYKIVDLHFEDLLQGRYQTLKKKLQVSDLSVALHLLSQLCLRPNDPFQPEPVPILYPDLRFEKRETGWLVEINEEREPKLRIQTQYAEIKPQSAEEKETLKGYLSSAKWLLHSLSRRKKLLLLIGNALIKKQGAYLEQKGNLVAYSVKDLAHELQIHESTLSRALADKYVETPRGILALRSLLTNAPETLSAQECLARLIQEENKRHPWTDEALAEQLKKQGFSLSRRTVAKYRGQLKIGSANQRKQFGM